jgi:PAS domain S-box-containing protein
MTLAHATPDGGIQLSTIARDITESRRSAADLRASDERLRFAIEAAGMGVWEVDVRTRHVTWTEMKLPGLGDPPRRFAGDADTFFAGIHPDDRDAVRRDVDRAIVERQDLTMMFRALGPAEETSWVEWRGRAIYEPDMTPTQILGVSTDVTKREVLEAQLRQAQKMDAIGQLTGGVAHDFNNLLTVIAGHTDMLLSEKGPAQHDLEQIRQASDRAASMTRQLLAFSRQSVLEPKVVKLNAVVSEMETMLRRSIGEDVELIVRAAPDAHHVKADPDQLGRALINMAINARDAMPDGGTLTIETRNVNLPKEIAGAALDAGTTPYVLLAISDTGCGMTAETKARLFEPFFTTKGPGKGTGLGLAVVDGIVKQSGGRIEVYSEPDVGTTFKVYGPATYERDAGAAQPSDGRQPRGNETVLLVEDEPAVREMTQAALQRHGYTVLPAASGAEALQIARANQGAIKVVLTDVVMPGMSGPQLVERLREEQPELAALFMSGYTSDAVLRHGIETGEADFLQKPFSTSALAAKLRQVLDR